MKYCPECGTQNDGFKFCPNCGFNFSSTNFDFANIEKGNTIGISQTSNIDFLLKASIKDNWGNLKYGFVELTGNWVIQPMFNELAYFDEKEYCRAGLNGKYGFINRQGNWVIQPMFDNVGDFDEESFGRAELNGKYGFINRQGNWVIQPMFDNVGDFDEESFGRAELNGKYGFINRQGNWIIQPMFDRVGDFDEESFGRAELNGKYGFINRQGNWVIQPMFDDVKMFDKEGYCSVLLNGKAGFISSKGEWIIQPKYEVRDTWGMFFYLPNFDEKDMCVVKANGKFGIIDRRGNWVIQPAFEEISEFNEFDTCCIKQKGEDSTYHYGLMNRQGIILIEPIFWSNIIFTRKGNFGIVFQDSRHGLITKEGEWLIKPKYWILEESEIEGIFKASDSNKYGFIDKNGIWLIKPKIDYIYSDFDGDNMVWDDNKREWVYDNPLNESFEYDFESYFGHLTRKIKLYLSDGIPTKKINAYKQRICKALDDDIIETLQYNVYFDDTVFGKGDDGLLIASDDSNQIFFYYAMLGGQCGRLPFYNIKQIKHERKKLIIECMDDEMIELNITNDKEISEPLISFFNDHFNSDDIDYTEESPIPLKDGAGIR